MRSLPPVVDLYGVGTFGQELAGALVRAGIVVRSVIDRLTPPSPLTAPYVHVDEATWDHPVVIGVCNPAVDIVSLAKGLHDRGAPEVISPVSAAIWAYRESGVLVTNYWLTGDVSVYRRDGDVIERARACLTDEKSRATFDSAAGYRSTGDLDRLIQPESLDEQYFPADIDFITSHMRYVDAGAFDGDTIRALRRSGSDISALLALEPDPCNYLSTVASLADWTGVQSVAVPLALSDELGLATFEGSGSSSSAVTADGRLTVQCAPLDDVAYGWRPSHVKMDIEGGEVAAVGGMKRLLRDQSPRLAVATYHRPADMWTLINAIASAADYHLSLRTYAEQTFETVMYAIPR